MRINESEVGIVKDIFTLSLRGEGIKDIAKKLNRDGIYKRTGKPWTNSTIGYVLSNPIYTGCLFWNEGKHNPNAEKPVIKIPNTHAIELLFRRICLTNRVRESTRELKK